ncbi:MAG TPA: nicotinate-nucleotide--dimethylbenzimidazole phosphoribosyltransferase, partial [Dehalococcoidia bacterium]|nr:nicotinate-nucleotide--dimethylbenzimidazole phosphoribosyltransferase [Dehalococcoidia bacterium]
HRVMLERLELTPLLNLNLRLGEGTGAALALPLVEAAARLLDEMATFDEAGVSDVRITDGGQRPMDRPSSPVGGPPAAIPQRELP